MRCGLLTDTVMSPCHLWRWIWNDWSEPSQLAPLTLNERTHARDGRSHEGCRLWPWTRKEITAYWGLQLLFSVSINIVPPAKTGGIIREAHQPDMLTSILRLKTAKMSCFSEKPNLGHLLPSGSILATWYPCHWFHPSFQILPGHQ